MSAIDDLVTRNASATAPEGASAVPSTHAVVLTCMDARINVYDAFGLAPGQAHVLRNAGGAVTEDVIRSLAISQRELQTREVLVVQHTSCGMSTVTEDGFKAAVEADTGMRPPWSVESFADVRANVRQSVRRVEQNPFVPHRDKVRGFVFDVETAKVTEVDCG